MPRRTTTVVSVALSDEEIRAVHRAAPDATTTTGAVRAVVLAALGLPDRALRGRPLVELARADITDALAHYGGRIGAAARALGISGPTLRRECERHGIATAEWARKDALSATENR